MGMFSKNTETKQKSGLFGTAINIEDKKDS